MSARTCYMAQPGWSACRGRRCDLLPGGIHRVKTVEDRIFEMQITVLCLEVAASDLLYALQEAEVIDNE